MTEDGDEIAPRQQGHLAVGDLDIAFGTQVQPEPVELTAHLVHTQRRGEIRVRAEIATGAREVTPGVRPHRGPATGGLPAKPLRAPPDDRFQRVPATPEDRPLLGGHRLAEETQRGRQRPERRTHDPLTVICMPAGP